MRFLVTGHTGFKGSWLTLLLRSRGHDVIGLALDPEPGGLFERAAIAGDTLLDLRGDVRDADTVVQAMSTATPDVVVHMAAQPLVRASLDRPRETIETNVMGTLNVLEAVRAADGVRALVVVTTDKVYATDHPASARVEGDPLGGDDPYSVSKAMADLMTSAWRIGFLGERAVTARAGNVIGGGDISRDRLLPDLLAAFARGSEPLIRYPDAVRPWQHVLDALNGYLLLVEATLAGSIGAESVSWNFGPAGGPDLTVGQVADRVAALWGRGATWQLDEGSNPAETHELRLDPSKAVSELGWRPRLTAQEAIEWTVEWSAMTSAGEDARSVTTRQIEQFEQLSP